MPKSSENWSDPVITLFRSRPRNLPPPMASAGLLGPDLVLNFSTPCCFIHEGESQHEDELFYGPGRVAGSGGISNPLSHLDACRVGSRNQHHDNSSATGGNRGAPRPQRVIQPPLFRRVQVHLMFLERRSLQLANFLRCWPESCRTSTCSYTAHVVTCAIHSLIHPDFLEHKRLLST